MEPRLFSRPAHSLVTIFTELTRLLVNGPSKVANKVVTAPETLTAIPVKA
jgi:hypothetical protein